MPTQRSTLYWLTGREGYWVISHGGYDVGSFTDKAEAQRFYDDCVRDEQKAKAGCPFERKVR